MLEATQYDYLDAARGFIALKSKYLRFFSLRSGSRYVVGDISLVVAMRFSFLLACWTLLE
jgi:hypothetical protein